MEIWKRKKKLANIKDFNWRKNSIKLIDDYDLAILEVKRKAAEVEPEPRPSKAKIKCKKSPLELCAEYINENKMM